LGQSTAEIDRSIRVSLSLRLGGVLDRRFWNVFSRDEYPVFRLLTDSD